MSNAGGERDVARLDVCVASIRGFTRAYAKEVIEAGHVTVRGKTEMRPGVYVSARDVAVMADDMRFVSRGGYKLLAALDAFGIDVSGALCLDAGASTGGFTDCLLQRGAAKVYAVDVGRGQLADKLRADPRVVSMEETDIRGLSLPAPVDFVAADVSFISLTKIIPSLRAVTRPFGGLVCLIKPQFETRRTGMNKKGIVTSEKARKSAADGVLAALVAGGFAVKGIIESPITGRDGNVEYLAYGAATPAQDDGTSRTERI